MTLPAKKSTTDQADAIERALVSGDLAPLTPEERVVYYNRTCESLGLNPYTKPFSYMILQGKLTLYANRSGADQLRKIHNVSLEIVSRDITDDILSVHVRAKLPDGRSDEDVGAVPFPETLRGENRANAELKCVTKAKRRATLSICGLGWLDETEVDSIRSAEKIEEAKKPIAKPDAMATTKNTIRYDKETGEIDALEEALDSQAVPGPAGSAAAPATAAHPQDAAADEPPEFHDETDAIIWWNNQLLKASGTGTAPLQLLWKKVPKEIKTSLKEALDRRYKPNALRIDERAV